MVSWFLCVCVCVWGEGGGGAGRIGFPVVGSVVDGFENQRIEWVLWDSLDGSSWEGGI